MPINEHSCRLLDPGKFKDGSFRRTKRKHDGKEYSIIMGRLKGETTMTEQAYRYSKDVWSSSGAKTHCKDHDGSFTPAGESDNIKLEELEEMTLHEDPAVIEENTPQDDPEEKSITEKNDPIKSNSIRIENNIERRFLKDNELRIKDDGDDESIITGYAARFDVWSEPLGFFKERIRPGAFKKTIKENDIRSLINHDPNLILGRTKNKTLELWEDDKGLRFDNRLPGTSYADDLKISIKRKDITQNSFGFQTIQDEWSKDGKKRDLIEARLFDISPVTFPAYPQTSVKLRLRDIGIDYDTLILALIRADRGIVTGSDIDLFRSTMKILNSYIPIEEEPSTEGIPGHPEEPSIVDDPGHSEDPEEPAINATLIRARLANMAIRKYINRSKL